jgi:4-amino-4-deoxy-L-arabinose transferase-like glycosyltransferase
MPEDSWWNKAVHIVRSIFKEEVKTPLSFFFRVTVVLPVLLLPILVAGGTADFKIRVLLLGLGMLLALCVVVAIFAWFKPKNLVYGESGHRAEFKVEFGTEKHVITHRQVETLVGEENPKVLPQAATAGEVTEENA